jgi:hypothetical protein
MALITLRNTTMVSRCLSRPAWPASLRWVIPSPKCLYCLADDTSVAGLEVRVYANEKAPTSRGRTDVLRKGDCQSTSQIKDILDNCGRILKPLQEIQEALLPLLQRLKDSPSKLLQVALRVRWTFVSKGKVFFYRELLQRQHQMLDNPSGASRSRLDTGEEE